MAWGIPEKGSEKDLYQVFFFYPIPKRQSLLGKASFFSIDKKRNQKKEREIKTILKAIERKLHDVSPKKNLKKGAKQSKQKRNERF